MGVTNVNTPGFGKIEQALVQENRKSYADILKRAVEEKHSLRRRASLGNTQADVARASICDYLRYGP